MLFDEIQCTILTLISSCRPILTEKMGAAAMQAPKSLGPHWMDPLGQPLSRNHVFKIFNPEIPSKT